MCTLTMLAKNPHIGLSISRTALAAVEASYSLLVVRVSFWEGKQCSQGNLDSGEERSHAQNNSVSTVTEVKPEHIRSYLLRDTTDHLRNGD